MGCCVNNAPVIIVVGYMYISGDDVEDAEDDDDEQVLNWRRRHLVTSFRCHYAAMFVLELIDSEICRDRDRSRSRTCTLYSSR